MGDPDPWVEAGHLRARLEIAEAQAADLFMGAFDAKVERDRLRLLCGWAAGEAADLMSDGDTWTIPPEKQGRADALVAKLRGADDEGEGVMADSRVRVAMTLAPEGVAAMSEEIATLRAECDRLRADLAECDADRTRSAASPACSPTSTATAPTMTPRRGSGEARPVIATTKTGPLEWMVYRDLRFVCWLIKRVDGWTGTVEWYAETGPAGPRRRTWRLDARSFHEAKRAAAGVPRG